MHEKCNTRNKMSMPSASSHRHNQPKHKEWEWEWKNCVAEQQSRYRHHLQIDESKRQTNDKALCVSYLNELHDCWLHRCFQLNYWTSIWIQHPVDLHQRCILSGPVPVLPHHKYVADLGYMMVHLFIQWQSYRIISEMNLLNFLSNGIIAFIWSFLDRSWKLFARKQF